MREKTILAGVLFTAAYCLVGVISGISKYMQVKWGFAPSELTFFTFAVVAICNIPWIIRQGGIKALKTNNFLLLLLRAILGLSLYLLFFTASHMIPLVDAVTFLNTAPLWVPLLAMFTLRERLSSKAALCILGGFIGMLLIIHPRLQGMNLTGDVMALSAGIITAATIVLMRKLKSEPWQRVVFIYAVVATAISCILMIPSFKMPIGIQWFIFLGMGVIMYLIQCLATIALHSAKATTLGPLTYGSIIVSGIIGWLAWGQIPTLLTMTGMIVIIASGILIVIFESKEQKA